MKILISGCTGFIGGYLAARLLREGHEVSAIVRQSTDKQNLPKGNISIFVLSAEIEELILFLEKEKFDGVIHLASLFLYAHKSSDVKGLIDSNVLFSTILLEAAVAAKVPWFINTGTFWQYYENKEYSPVNLYAATKQAFETIASYYLQISPIIYVTLKLSDTFGPGDRRPKIFNLWSNIAKSGQSLEMSPGQQLIDISYIDNVIDGYMQLVSLLSADTAPEIHGRSFALQSNERMTLKELAAVFEEVTGTKLNIAWGKKEYRPREVMVPWETGETVPGWQPNVSLREGIKRTFNER